MRIARVFLLLFLSSAALGDLVITSITPNEGPVAGGTTVIIRGTGFVEECVICSPPSGRPEVLFGGTPATFARYVDPTTLEAVTPAHLPGTWSMTVSQVAGLSAFVPNAFTFTGETDEAFDPILFPIYMPPVQGAFGSEFHTQAMVGNKGPIAPSILYGLDSICYLFSPIISPENPFRIGRGQDQPLLPACNEATGRLFYVPKDTGDSLAASLRVTDVTRQADSHGVEIPVVRRDDFTQAPIALLGVPIDLRFRNALRIYSLARESVVVNVKMDKASRQITLAPGKNIFEPAFAVTTDFPKPHELPAGQNTIRVTVQTTGAPVWAFITVTNNETQHITTVAP